MKRWRSEPNERRMCRAGAAALALMSSLLLLGSTAASVVAQSQTDLLLHGAVLSYSDSELKDSGYATGVYASWGTGWKHFLETGATYTAIDYLGGYTLEQVDVTAAYSRFWAGGAVRLGAHLVETNDTLTDGGLVAFGGASVYRPGAWSLGTEASLSSYGNYGAGLTVTQLTPSMGISAGDAETGVGVGATLRGYYVHLSEEVGLAQLDFYSGEAGLSLTRGRVTVSGIGWLGEQAFAVRSGGFLVYNIAEMHTGGFGGGMRVLLSPKAALSAGLYVERVRNPTLAGTANSLSLAFSTGFTL